MALLSLVLGIPDLKDNRHKPTEETEIEVPEEWRPERCCQAFTRSLDGRIALSLPEGWTIQAGPKIAALDAPWMSTRVESGTDWTFELELRRGSFPPGSEEQRRKDRGQ